MGMKPLECHEGVGIGAEGVSTIGDWVRHTHGLGRLARGPVLRRTGYDRPLASSD